VEHGVDAHAVVEDDFDERVAGVLADHGDGNRPTTEDVGDLPGVGVATLVRGEVRDEDHFRRPGALGRPVAAGHAHEHVRGGSGACDVVAAAARGAPGAVGLDVESVHQGDTDFGWEERVDADHAELVVDPMRHLAGGVLAGMQHLDIHGGQPVGAGAVTHRPQPGGAGKPQQLGFVLGGRRGDGGGLRDRHLTRRECTSGLGTFLDVVERVELAARFCPRGTGGGGHPVGGRGMTPPAVLPTCGSPGREPHPGGRARFLRAGELLGDVCGVLARVPAGLGREQPRPQRRRQTTHSGHQNLRTDTNNGPTGKSGEAHAS
jgi:hypothetical protein